MSRITRRVEIVYFKTVLPNRVKHESKEIQSKHLMQQAAHALAHEILEIDGAIHINTEYDLLTQETRIEHQVRVVIMQEK